MRHGLVHRAGYGILPAVCGLVLAVGACATPLAASPDRPSLDRAGARLFFLMEKGRRANYQGKQKTEVLLGKRRSSGLAVVKQYRGCVRTEMLQPDRMKGMIVLERGDRRVVHRPGETTWHSRPTADARSSHRLLRNYTFQSTGTANLAGRPALIAEIRARVPGRPWRKVWVDSETGVVLRAEMYNYRGEQVYATEFQEIDFKSLLDPDEFQIPSVNPTEEPQELRPDQCASVPRPSYLPVGYGGAGRPRLLHTRRGDAYHLRFTDGLSTISVFLRKTDPSEAERPARPTRPMEPLSQSGRAVKGDLRVMVLGDVDHSELQRIADSVQP